MDDSTKMEILLKAQKVGLNLMRKGDRYILISVEPHFEGSWFIPDLRKISYLREIKESFAYKLISIDSNKVTLEGYPLEIINEPYAQTIPKIVQSPGHFKISNIPESKICGNLDVEVVNGKVYLLLTTETRYYPFYYIGKNVKDSIFTFDYFPRFETKKDEMLGMIRL